MRTNRDKLQALADYFQLNYRMTRMRLEAELFFANEIDEIGWNYLFCWAEAKDEKEEMWEWFQHEFQDAIAVAKGQA